MYVSAGGVEPTGLEVLRLCLYTFNFVQEMTYTQEGTYTSYIYRLNFHIETHPSNQHPDQETEHSQQPQSHFHRSVWPVFVVYLDENYTVYAPLCLALIINIIYVGFLHIVMCNCLLSTHNLYMTALCENVFPVLLLMGI